jgi:hypothetical protein
MRIVLAALALAALAACDSPGSNDQAAANASGAKPEDAPAPAAPADEAAGLAQLRAEWLPACIGGARDAAPARAPVERHCECAIDRTMADRTLAQLEAERLTGEYGARFQANMRACIAEIRY